MTQSRNGTAGGYRFGTFDGVFLPSLLTILGVVMFLRIGNVVGDLGVVGALGILAVAESIAVATGLSLSAISSNTLVLGGGPYFLISRALGPGFGTAIGLTYYLAQALSVPFYLLGFAEALVAVFPSLAPHALWVGVIPLCILFAIAVVGADWAVKTQYIIAGVLALSVVTILGGAMASGPTLERLRLNFLPSAAVQLNIFTVVHYFAIFFPAVTGFLAGVNMSGDLANPRRSIPRGVLGAILTGMGIYLLEILLCGSAWGRPALSENFYGTLHANALLGAGVLVLGGMVAATLSSALGTLLGAPRVLQAFAADGIFSSLKCFAKGRGKGNDPVLAMVLTFAVALLTILWGNHAAAGEGANALNVVAELVTTFMLCTYAIINLSAAVESFAANPSFRPNFRFFHWSVGVYGAAICLLVASFIDFLLMLVALAVIAVIFTLLRHRSLESTFGDARRGYYYERIRLALQRLSSLPADPKNWRPQFVVLAESEERHRQLIEYAGLLNNRRGILTMGCIVPLPARHGGLEAMPGNPSPEELRRGQLQRMAAFARKHGVTLFPVAVAAPENDFDASLNVFLQAYALGPLTPNIVMLGWPADPGRVEAYCRHIGVVCRLRKSCVLMLNSERACPPDAPEGTIDVWWRGRINGSLMLILAYLLTCNPSWRKCQLRLLRITTPDEKESAERELHELVEEARIQAQCLAIVSKRSFADVLREYSADAAVLFLGFIPPEEGQERVFHENYRRMLAGLPMSFLVASAGDARLTS